MSTDRMTRDEALKAIKQARTIDVWVIFTEDDGRWFKVTKTEAREQIAMSSPTTPLIISWLNDDSKTLLIG